MARLFVAYLEYREMSGMEAFDLSPRELALRMGARDSLRYRAREDGYRFTSAAVATAFGETDAGKIFLGE